MRRAPLVVAAVALGAAAAVAAVASAGEQAARPLPGLPAYTAGYQSWTKINGAPIQPRTSDPHRGVKNVFTSRAKRGRTYPYGTVVVKEVRRGGYIALIAVMRKVRGSNPRHNDWTMIEWHRSTARARFTELARGAVCTSCHVGARANDYVFTRR